MQVQVNSDRNIEISAEMIASIEADVQDSLRRYSDRITRVEVHVSDQNSSQKTADNDIRCKLEARLAGQKPIVVSADASIIDHAVSAASDKMLRTLESSLGKLENKKGRTSFAGEYE